MNKYALRQTPLAAAIACVIASGSSQAATITVNSLNDTVVAAECSLRAAIESANTATAVGGCDSGSTDADEIVFDQSLVESTITIESALTIENSLTISGPGSELLAIGSNSSINIDGMFHVDFSSNPDQELIIRGLTLRDGHAEFTGGGAIRMQTPGPGYSAALTVEDSVLVNHYSKKYSGGAIAFRTDDCGGLTVRNSMISSNRSDESGGAIHFQAGPDCLLSIENSLLTHNESDEVGGAIYADSDNLHMSITDNSLLAFNRARYVGGGLAVYAQQGAEISIQDSQLVGNDVRYYDGGGMAIWAPDASAGSGFQLEVDNSQIRGNRSNAEYGSGGGMAVMVDNEYGANEAIVTITDSVISGNVSGNTVNKYSSYGGGGASLDLRATDLTISGSRFEHNSASTGGGLMAEVSYGGMVTISDSRFHGNLAAGLGGLGLVGATETLIERTVVHDNLASALGGAVLDSEDLVVRDSEFSANTSMKYVNTVLGSKYSLVVENTTISGNTTKAGFTGAVLYGDNVSARFLTVTDNTLSVEEGSGKYGASGLSVYANNDCLIDSSLVALNSSSTGPTDLYAPDCEVSWSLIGDSANTEYIDAGNNLVDVNPVIGPLADNGGPTRSHALGETSPAINRGNPAFVPPPEFDQRGPGFLRVFGGQVDIGAFELQREPEDEVFSDRFEAEP